MPLKKFEGKCLKVTLEFENITKILEGEEPSRWLKELDRFVMLGLTHGMIFSNHNWKIINKKEKQNE